MKPKVYGCKDARSDIDYFFQYNNIYCGPKATKGLKRAIEHMTQGTTVGHHNISCQPCWDYRMGMKQKYCGG